MPLRPSLFFLALIAGMLHGGTADAGMLTGTATSQPVGHYEFCKRNRAECGPTRVSGAVMITDATWRTLLDINAAVNAGIEAHTDEEIYGVAEYWDYPTTVGDCEDFALLKQFMLEREGFPRSALLLTVVRQPNGDGHAVLTVRTDRGDVVLDNLDGRVRDWTQTPYRYLKRQSESNSSVWVSIDDDRNMLVGSVR